MRVDKEKEESPSLCSQVKSPSSFFKNSNVSVSDEVVFIECSPLAPFRLKLELY